jgi:hypothetical protein
VSNVKFCDSVRDVWKNVNKSMADFKELIPEFYDTDSGGEFCVNKFGINFGYRHDGAKVGDVELPPWAQGSKSCMLHNEVLRETGYFILAKAAIVT